MHCANGHWVKVCEVSELPTLPGTSDRRNSRRTHLKTSRWALAYYTGHVRYNTRHIRCDQSVNPPSQLSTRHQNSQRLSKLPTVETPDSRRNSRRTNPRTPSILSWPGKYRTHLVLPNQQKQVSSFVSQTLKTHMGWHEHLWMIIYQYDASLLIVWHIYNSSLTKKGIWSAWVEFPWTKMP